jgi:hypothetical protein
LSYVFKFIRIHPAPAQEVARGGLTVVCVRHEGGKMAACTIPKSVADKIEVAPAEMLR